MSKMKTIYEVWAPGEGDGMADAVGWYFRKREDAENFANEAPDHEILNPHEGPYEVREMEVTADEYKRTVFTEYSS